MIRGIGTSKGIGMGNAVIVDIKDAQVNVKKISDTDIASEKKRFKHAVDEFIKSTQTVMEQLSKKLKDNNNTALVMQNQIYLIKDPEMIDGVNNIIENEKLSAEVAFDKVCNNFIKIFQSMDNEAMNQRVADIEDLRNHVIDILMGVKKVDLARLKPGTIIVAKELRPSITASMDIDNVVGIIAENGGETSHASILARALEIPAVLNVKGACERIKNDDYVIVDGEYGEIFVNPIERTIKIYEKKRTRFLEVQEELKQYVNKETCTADNIKVCLAANIGNADDATKAMTAGAEGIGLFRTEFLFMNGVKMPTEQEQFEAYKKAVILCKDKFLTIRTLDIGGDKDIPYMGLAKESNPFLGYRAIRFCLDRIDVFTVQLRAILRASAFGRIRIMIPMITSVSEVRQVKNIITKIMSNLERDNIEFDKNIQLGVMIETPAAAMMADVLAKEVDFFSIGTNDLTQYVMAVDRGNENVAYLYSVFNPAVLRFIKRIIKAGKEEGIEVGMCGEAAGNPAMIPLLLAYGLDEFSVTPSKVLETRKNIASWTMKEACELESKVANMVTEKEVAMYVNDYIRRSYGAGI